jgi:hypothetical protein
MLHKYFHELLSAFSDAGVEFLLVGAYALAVHGRVRATNDLDIWVRVSPENARRIHAALLAFGAPADRVSREDFLRRDTVVQIGVEPVRVDILTSISGVDFDAAWRSRMSVTIAGVSIPVLDRQHLIENKRASGRDKDRLDLEWLEGDHGPS